MFELVISFAIAATSIVWSIWVIGRAFEDETTELEKQASTQGRVSEAFKSERSNGH